MVDDGSSDGSWTILEGWAREDKRFRVFGLSRNFGQHAAITAGFERGRGRIIMTIDDDLQIPHEVIPSFIAAINSGHDVVAGYRRHRNDSVLLRQVPSRLVNIMLCRLTGLPRRDYGCNHVAYRRWVVDAILSCPDIKRFTPEILAWSGVQVHEIEVPHFAGPSRYSFAKLLKLNLFFLAHYTFWPMNVVTLLSGIFLIIFTILNLSGMSWWNFGSHASTTLLMGGIGLLLLMTGISANVMERLVVECIRRPLYLLRPERVVDAASCRRQTP